MPENTNPIKLYFTSCGKIEGLYQEKILKVNNEEIPETYRTFIVNLRNNNIKTFEDLINKINNSKHIPEIKLSDFDSTNKPFIYLIDDAFYLDAFNVKKYNECQIAFVHDDYTEKNPYTLPQTRNIILFVHTQTNESFYSAEVRNEPSINTINKFITQHEILMDGKLTDYTLTLLGIIKHYNNNINNKKVNNGI